MFGCRTAIRVGCYALAIGLVSACGGSVEHNDGTGAGSSQGGATAGKAGATSGTGRAGGASAAGGSDVQPGPDVVDPEPIDSGCPPQDLPPPELECDPFTAGSCGPGAMGCYPFVDHPKGSGCDQQRYGTQCLPAGQGSQGVLCGDETGDWCAAGFVCVVGQRAGKRCAALCQLGVANSCSGGLICGDLDVAGFGVCG